MANKNLKVTILGDAKSLKRTLQGAGADLGKFGDKSSRVAGALKKGFGTAFKGIAVAGAAALAGVGVAAAGTLKIIGESIKLAAEAEEVQALLESTIASTGASSWITADALQAQATALQGMTLYGDEAVKEVQTWMLTFKQVTNGVGENADTFDRATVAALDMATVLKTDTKSATMMLGKALNDPIIGMSAMSRAGITFTQEQKDMVKELWESGDALAAQAIILDEVESQFGGASEAAAQAGLGPFQQFKNIVGDIGEVIGAVFLPGLRSLAKWATAAGTKLLEWFQTEEGAALLGELTNKFQSFISDIKTNALQAKRALAPVWEAFKEGDNLEEKLANVKEALLEMIPDSVRDKVQGIIDKVGEFTGGKGLDLKALTDSLKGAFLMLSGPLGLIVRDLLPALAPVIQAVLPPMSEVAQAVAPALAEILGILAENIIPGLVVMLEGLAEFLAENGPLVKGILATLATWKILTTVMSANPWALLIGFIIGLVAFIVTNWDTIKEKLQKVWRWITDNAAKVGKWFSDKFTEAVNIVKGLFLNFTPLGLLIQHFDTIKEKVTGVKDWFVDRFNDVVDFMTDLPGRIGRAVSGMWDGVKDTFRGVINTVIGWWNDLSFELRIPTNVVTEFLQIAGKGFTLNTPNIPKFHTGGVVPGRPGQEQLAVLMAGETVIPAGQSAGTNIGQQVFEIHSQADPYAIANAVGWKLRTQGL